MTNFKYKPDGEVAKSFLKDETFFRGLRGPVGSGKSVPPAKKSSKAVQAVVEEEQRQMKMSFADQVEMQIEEIDGGGIDRLDTVVDDLDGLESRLKQGEGVSG